MKQKFLRAPLSLMVVLGGLAMSSSALACSPNLPNYGNCVRMRQEQAQQIMMQGSQQNSGYSNGGSSGDVWYRYRYLAVLQEKSGKPRFYKTYRRTTSPTLQDWQYDAGAEDVLARCNSFKSRAPCKLLNHMIGEGCMAYIDAPDIIYTDKAETCSAAKQKVTERCMARYNDSKICSRTKSTTPVSFLRE